MKNQYEKFSSTEETSGLFLSEKEFLKKIPNIKNIFKNLEVKLSFKNKKKQVGGISQPTCSELKSVSISNLVTKKKSIWKSRNSNFIMNDNLRHSFVNLQQNMGVTVWQNIDPWKYINISEESFYAFTTKAFSEYLKFSLNLLSEEGQSRLEDNFSFLHADFYSLEIGEEAEAEGVDFVRQYSPLCDQANIMRNTYLAFSSRNRNTPPHDCARAIMWRGYGGNLPELWKTSIEDYLSLYKQWDEAGSLPEEKFNFSESQRELLPTITPICCQSWTIDVEIAISSPGVELSMVDDEGIMNLFMAKHVDPGASAIIANVSHKPEEKEVIVNYFTKYTIISIELLRSIEDITEFVRSILQNFNNGRLMRQAIYSDAIERIFDESKPFKDVFESIFNNPLVKGIRIIIVDINLPDPSIAPSAWQEANSRVRGIRVELEALEQQEARLIVGLSELPLIGQEHRQVLNDTQRGLELIRERIYELSDELITPQLYGGSRKKTKRRSRKIKRRYKKRSKIKKRTKRKKTHKKKKSK